ncbi:hypothetical protein YC2023_043819 [Brassica napus]
MSDHNANDNGTKPISETSSGTSLTTPQSERISGGFVERVSARIGRDIPPLNMEGISRFANSFGNQNLVHFPISVTSPGFSSLSPSLQSLNMFANSSSQEMVESSGGAHVTMMISNNNLPHQPLDIDLPPQGCKKGTADIPTEESVDITSHESNADPIGAPLLPSFDSEVVAEKDATNLSSLKSESNIRYRVFSLTKMSDHNSNDNGTKPISETSSGTSLTTPQSERISGGFVERVSARIGRDIPPLNMEGISRFANSFGNQNLVHFPISVTSPGFSSLSPSLQSPNMFANSSSQEMVESSGGAHATMMISNNNLPHQPLDIDLPSQGCKKGTADIPTEVSVDITSHESNADSIGAPLLPSFDSDVVAEKDATNLSSLKSGSEDGNKDK